MDELIIKNDILYENIRYEIENVNYFGNKIIPYNVQSKIPMHKFWVYIDKSRVTKNTCKNGFKYLTIALSINNDGIQFVKQIEKKINEKIQNDRESSHVCFSKLNDDVDIGIPTFELCIDKNTIMFNIDDVIFENSWNIQIGNELSLICELDNIYQSNNCLKSNWRIVQLKKIQSVNLKTSLFPKTQQVQSVLTNKIQSVQIIQDTNTIKQLIEPIQNSLTLPSAKDLQSAIFELKKVKSDNIISDTLLLKSNQSIQNTKIKPLFTILTAQDLQNAKFGLKKIKNTNDDNIIIDNIQTTLFPKVSELKHVETRETDIIQIFRDEYKKSKNITNEDIIRDQYNEILYIEKIRKKIKKYKKRVEKLLNLI